MRQLLALGRGDQPIAFAYAEGSDVSGVLGVYELAFFWLVEDHHFVADSVDKDRPFQRDKRLSKCLNFDAIDPTQMGIGFGLLLVLGFGQLGAKGIKPV